MARENPILLLLSPLQKIEQVSTETVKVLQDISTQIESVIKSGIEVKNIFVEQRDALFDMRTSLKSIELSLAGQTVSPKANKGAPSVGTSFKIGTLLIFAAAGLAAASQFLQFTAKVSPQQLFTVLMISVAMQPMIRSFVGLIEIMAPAKTLLGRAGNFALDKIGAKKMTGGMSKNKAVGMAILVMISASITLVAVSALLKMMSAPSLSQIATALFIGVAMAPMAGTFIAVVKALRGARIAANKKGLKTVGFASLVMIAIALGIAGIALALQLLPPQFVEPPEIMWVLQTGFMLFVFSAPLTRIMKATKGLSVKQLVFAAIALPLIALTVVGIALAFKHLPAGIPAPELMWSLKTGVALFVIAFSFTRILKAIRRQSVKDLIYAGIAIPIIAGAIVGIAYIFMALANVAGYEKYAPDAVWALKSGIAVLAFTAGFILISMAAKRIGVKGLVLGALALIALAGVILATAWIFSVLPSEFIAPPTDWAVAAAIAITAFAIPLAVVGFLATVLTPLGILLGAAGIILIAGTMWVVAWIFSKLPDLSAASKNITDAIMYPVNQMIGALKRFKDEIGIENMVPLAGGILAIAGAWLTLTAAMAGQGVGGAIGAVGNLIGEGINKITEWFGGKKAMGPKELLEMLIDKAAGLKKISTPLKSIGIGFRGIGMHAGSVQLALGALLPFTEEDEREELEKSANAIKKIASGYRTISNATQTMNIDALNASSRMFEAIANIAKSDGKDAITKISEDLMEAVKQLSETVKNLEKSNGENSESMTDAISSTIGGFIDKIKGTTEDGNEAGLIDVEPIVLAIQELEDRLNRPLRVEEI